MMFDLNKRHCFYFYEISKIPHGSKNEKALSDYLVQFARNHGFQYVQDHVNNVIIYKSASPGCKQSEPLILQAHMDMVCEKTKESSHDFTKNSLKLVVKDGILKAEGTTLGADNGTGVAYMLAILEDETLIHPPLECVFTTMEEIGLLGAMELDSKLLAGKRMISLDGGGETRTLLSCAGGCTVKLMKTLKKEANCNSCFRVTVQGLLGGHSGGEIQKEKGNATLLCSRIVKEMMIKGAQIQLIGIEGGLKMNAIPREAEMIFASENTFEDLNAWMSESAKEIQDELEFSDPGFKAELFIEPMKDTRWTKQTTEDVMDMMYLMPNGFQHRSMAIEGLTLTSLNLGIVQTHETELEMVISIRSALESGKDHLKRKLSVLSKRLGFDAVMDNGFPGWNYSAKSKMRELYSEMVQKLYHKDLEIVASHGGCECGVFKGMIPEIDMISMGPQAAFVHTPDEQLDLASFDRTYELLRCIITECGK